MTPGRGGAHLAALALALATVGLATAARPQPAPVVRDLPYRREVLLPPAAPGAWVVVSADTLLMSRCAGDFADVRLVDEADSVLTLLSLPPRRFDVIPLLLGEHVLPWAERADGSLGCELDLGGPGGGDIALLPPPAATHDAWSWQCSPDRVRWGSPASFPHRPVPGQGPHEPPLLPVDLTPGCRFLRLERPREPAPSAPETLRVYRRERREVALLPVAFSDGGSSFTGGRLVQTLALTGPPSAIAGLRFDRPLREIHQELQLEAQLPRFGWRHLSLTREADPRLLRCDPVTTSALRLSAAGVDPDEPPFVVREALAVRQRWAFPHPGGRRVWLLYGDRWRTPRAGYAELGFALAPARLEASLGPEDRNPRFAPTGFGLAWLQRRPAVLTLVMLGILGLVAALAVGGRRRGTDR